MTQFATSVKTIAEQYVVDLDGIRDGLVARAAHHSDQQATIRRSSLLSLSLNSS
jgi:hypothetical protein